MQQMELVILRGILTFSDAEGTKYVIGYGDNGEFFINDYHKNSYINNIFKDYCKTKNNTVFFSGTVPYIPITIETDTRPFLPFSESWGNSAWHFGHYLADNLPILAEICELNTQFKLIDFSLPFSAIPKWKFELNEYYNISDKIIFLPTDQQNAFLCIGDVRWHHYRFTNPLYSVRTSPGMFRAKWLKRFKKREGNRNKRLSDVSILFLSRKMQKRKRFLNEQTVSSFLLKHLQANPSFAECRSIEVKIISPELYGIAEMTDVLANTTLCISPASSALYHPLLLVDTPLIWFDHQSARRSSNPWVISTHISEYGVANVLCIDSLEYFDFAGEDYYLYPDKVVPIIIEFMLHSYSTS
jgi:hypothetical protein